MSSSKRSERSNFTKMCVDIFAGTIAGINVTMVGHPFDTLKVRLQTQPSINPIYKGVADCFWKTLKWEGFSGLYKGVQAPLIGAIIFRANMFFAFGEAKRFFSNYGKNKLQVKHYYFAGAVAWGWGALIECPIDFFKTQMQIQIIRAKTIENFKPEYYGMIDCFKKIIKSNGIIGAYQGFIPHVIRNIPAGSVHLGTFELLRARFAEKLNCTPSTLPVKYNMMAGATGGVLFWALFFPFDVVKSAIQADSPYRDQKKYNGLLDTYKKLYAEGNIKRFYKGFSPCMMRAIPANVVLLMTSSYISEHL